jgi:GNAT superfamily N-acetyltransferase
MKTFKQFCESAEFTYGKSLVGDDGEKIHHEGGYIDIKHKNTDYAPRKQSVVDFVVNEDRRGQGIGHKLVAHALTRHNDLGAQASSAASVKVFHDHGFRHPAMPHGSLQEHLDKLHEDSSVFMAHKDADGKPYK